MASLSDSDDDDSVFQDAKSSFSNHEYDYMLVANEPRWRVSSKTDPTEYYGPLTINETQRKDFERRDKLKRLRDQDNSNNKTPLNTLIETQNEPNSILSSSTVVEEDSSESHSDSNRDEEHTETTQTIYQRKNSTVSAAKEIPTNSAAESREHYQQHSVPTSRSRSNSAYYHKRKSFSAGSEPNMIDLETIDHITKFGKISPNSQKLEDEEILRQAIVLNLDSGKYIPFSNTNPMMRTIMARTHRSGSIITLRHNSILNTQNTLRPYSADFEELQQTDFNLSSRVHNVKDEDDGNESSSSESSSTKSSRINTLSLSPSTEHTSALAAQSSSSLKAQFKKLVVNKILRKKKPKPTDDQQNTRYLDDDDDDTERSLINDGSNGDLKYKASRYLKDPTNFDRTQLLQTIANAHDGPIWCMRFSPDGFLLATGGNDCLLKIWLLKSIHSCFDDFARSVSNLSRQQVDIFQTKTNEFRQRMSSDTTVLTMNGKLGLNEIQVPLYAKPFVEFLGHQAAVLDVAWSKSLFLLSSSMDKTVRLWHLIQSECLCSFRHIDFVSAIAFLPRDDRYFVSASLDGHLRLWDIPNKRVHRWALIPAQASSSKLTAAEANLITAVNFCDDGRKVTAGTFDGRFLSYNCSLEYDTVINISDKNSNRSRKKRRKPTKVTGIEAMSSNNFKVLITSNDSRIRLYNIRSKEIEHKYRGYLNQSSQIRASLSSDDRYIISGSEDCWIYIWKTEPRDSTLESPMNSRLSRKQRRYFGRAYERIRVHNTMVTAAIFAPNPNVIMNYLYTSNDCSPSMHRSVTSTMLNSDSNRLRAAPVNGASNLSEGSSATSHAESTYVMVTADSKGQLKLLVNRYHR